MFTVDVHERRCRNFVVLDYSICRLVNEVFVCALLTECSFLDRWLTCSEKISMRSHCSYQGTFLPARSAYRREVQIDVGA